jgi:hypothetical protein
LQLTPEGRRAADAAREVLATRGEVTPDIERAIARYARMSQLAERAWDSVPVDTLLTKGSTGQDVAHPAIAIAISAEREAARCAKELGIESIPMPVNKGGRPRGSANSPDRQPREKLRVVS